MGLLVKLFLLSLMLHLSASLWNPRKPVWYEELKAKCVGAEDEYYVDTTFRRCCKCSNCSRSSLRRRIPDCNVNNNCEAYDHDCVHDAVFDKVFNKIPTASPPRRSTNSPKLATTTTRLVQTSRIVHKPITSATTTSRRVVSDHASGDTSMVLVGVTAAAIVALLVAVIFLLRSKCGKTGSSSLTKLIHICKREKPSPSDNVPDTTESSREEKAHLVAECPNNNNEAPPPPISPLSPPLSGFGPPEMMHNERQRISSRNELSCDRSYGDSIGSSDMSDRPVATNHIQADRFPDCQSNNTGIVIPGSSNITFGLNNGSGNITFNQPRITICYGQGAEGAEPSPPTIGFDSDSRQRNIVHGDSQLCRPSSFLPPTDSQSAMGGSERSYPCFPSQKGGLCVTSASPPLSKDEEHDSRLRRQSSQISSTSSNGPVENSTGGIRSENSYPKEFSVREESNSPGAQHRSSVSIPSSHMSSRMNGPVQHSSRSRESLHQNLSNRHQCSVEDSAINTQYPQSDLESS